MGWNNFLGLFLQVGCAVCFRSEELHPLCGDVKLELDDILYLSTPHVGPGTTLSYEEYCTWTITSPAYTKIKIIFEAFVLEYHPTCAIDYVIIFNGNCGKNHSEGRRFCGIVPPPLSTSTTNTICLNFVSSMYTTEKKIILKAETITESSTEETTPKISFIAEYTTAKVSNTPQAPIIKTNLTTEQQKAQTNLQTETSSFAHLLNAYNSQLAGLKSSFLSLRLSTSTAIHHTTTSISSLDSLETIELCNVTRIFPIYNVIYVTSPNFGEDKKYPVSITCTTTFTTSVGYKMKIEFIHFDVEGNSLCSWDSLQVFDGADETRSIRNYCGTFMPDSFISTGSEICLKFTSDNIIPKSGFKAKITMFKADDISQRTPTSSSENNTKISSTAKPLSETGIRLFTLPSVSESTQRNNFFASLPSMTTTDHANYGSSVNADSSARSISVSLRPATQISFPAFSSTVPAYAFKVNQMCATTESIIVVDNILYLTSPGFDEYSKYPTSIVCTVSLQANIGSKLEISFLHFDLEGNSLCSWDSLQIFDGANDTGMLLWKLCGLSLPGPFSSNGRYLFLKFVSDEIIAKTGFKAKVVLVQVLNDQTSEVLQTQSGSYSPLLSAKSRTTTIPSSSKKLTIADSHAQFSMKLSTHEPSAQVSIQLSTPAPFAQFSTEPSTPATPAQFTTEPSTPKYLAQFSTEPSTTATRAQFSTEPSTTATRAQFSTEPSTTAIRAQFSTEPSTPATFTQFSNEPSTPENLSQFSSEPSTPENLSQFSSKPSIPATHLYISKEPSLSTRAIGHSDEPANNHSSNDKLAITQVIKSIQTTKALSGTQLTMPDLGFVLPQACSGDGMQILNSSGLISSPGLQSNDNYEHSVNCIWTIIGPARNTIFLMFEIFELEESDNCSKDSVTVYKSTIEDSNLIGRYCGHLEPFEIFTTDGKLFINFKTDQVGSARGFMAKYTVETPPVKAVCSDTQFQCDDNRCVAGNQRCNGIPDCQDETDEDFCVSITNINGSLKVMKENKLYPVCAVGWTTALGHKLCKMADYRDMASVSFLPLKVNTTMLLINSISNIHQSIEIR